MKQTSPRPAMSRYERFMEDRTRTEQREDIKRALALLVCSVSFLIACYVNS